MGEVSPVMKGPMGAWIWSIASVSCHCMEIEVCDHDN